jgi:hypothetical protein
MKNINSDLSGNKETGNELANLSDFFEKNFPGFKASSFIQNSFKHKFKFHIERWKKRIDDNEVKILKDQGQTPMVRRRLIDTNKTDLLAVANRKDIHFFTFSSILQTNFAARKRPSHHYHKNVINQKQNQINLHFYK